MFDAVSNLKIQILFIKANKTCNGTTVHIIKIKIKLTKNKITIKNLTIQVGKRK